MEDAPATVQFFESRKLNCSEKPPQGSRAEGGVFLVYCRRNLSEVLVAISGVVGNLPEVFVVLPSQSQGRRNLIVLGSQDV